MTLGIDHVLIAVESLDGALEAYKQLGFEAFYGGEHPNHGTHNALVPISGGFYLELIAVKNAELAKQFPHTKRILGALEQSNRYIQWALDTPNLDTELIELRGQGLKIDDPIPGARKRSDGVDVAWKTAHFTDPRLPFLIEDLTPRTTRIDEPQSGIAQLMALDSVVVGTAFPEETMRLYEKMLGSASENILPADRGSVIVELAEEELIQRVIYRSAHLDEIMATWAASDISFESANNSEGQPERIWLSEAPVGARFDIVAA